MSQRVVIIGAGIVGCSLAEELSARGWTSVTVLDAGPLFKTGGSTSHAPGLVYATNSSRTLAEFAKYTIEKFVSLTDADGSCFDQVGGLEIATTPLRLADLSRKAGWAASWGVNGKLVDADECVELFPLLDRDKVLGGWHTPDDGLASAVRAAKAQAKLAEERGVAFIGNQEVVAIEQENGAVTGVRTSDEFYPADVVVSAAGFWGQRIGALVGETVPLTPLAHQYVHTSDVAGLEDSPRLPILRHQDQDLYYRVHDQHIGIGSYAHRPMPVDMDEIFFDAPDQPSKLTYTPEDFAQQWEDSKQLLPTLSNAEVADGFNGIFSFTPDGMPILGPAKSVSGLWFAEAVWVTHSAGVGRAVAEWLVTGRSSVDLHECEIARFDAGQLAPAWIKARSCQNFVEVYDIIHPQQPIIDPRPLKVSPFYGRQQALGGEFLEAGGWERPHWYGANAGLVTGDEPAPNEWAAKYWSPIIAAEARVTRESVAVYDMTALRRIEVFGRDAEDFLHRVSTNNLHRKTGAVVYTLLLDNEGGVRSDVTVAKLGDTKFQLGVNTPSDQDWLERQIGRDEQVFLRDITDATCCIGLWGPKARDVVASISTIDFSHENFGYFTARTGFIGEVPVTALRLSYVGELGWELYADAAYGQRLWDVLFAAGAEHGIIAAGRGAFNSLRLEKGYRSAGADMTTEHDAVSSGLNFAVRKDKKAESTPTRVLAALVNPDPKAAVLGKEPVYHDGEAVGYVTSASFGYTIDKSIAYAWIPVELSAPDTVVEIEYFGTRLAYTVAEDPLYDPKMTRIRR